jgi:hypothetical protein
VEAAEEEEEDEEDDGDEGADGEGDAADDYLIAKMHLVDLVGSCRAAARNALSFGRPGRRCS